MAVSQQSSIRYYAGIESQLSDSLLSLELKIAESKGSILEERKKEFEIFSKSFEEIRKKITATRARLQYIGISERYSSQGINCSGRVEKFLK